MLKIFKEKLLNTIIVFLIFILLLALFSGCKSNTIYVPVESTRLEYKEKLIRDSIHSVDSIFVDRWKSNDTVFITKEKFKYQYKDKIRLDSIFINDTIKVPIPVVSEKTVKAPYNFIEKVLLSLGLICIGGIIFKLYKFIAKFKK